MKTAREVKQLQKWGKENEVISKLMEHDCHNQPRTHVFDYYHPSNANWNWEFGLVKIGESHYELLLQFGQVCGGREIVIPEYNMNLIK